MPDSILNLLFKIGARGDAAAGNSTAIEQQQANLQKQALASILPLTAECKAVLKLQSAFEALGPQMDRIAQTHVRMAAGQQKLADAMGQGVARAAVYGSSIGQAMEDAAKATVESIAARALTQALYSTALGLLLLAELDFPAAAQAFEAAALFGAIGSAAAAAGAAIPGGSRIGHSAALRYDGDQNRSGAASYGGISSALAAGAAAPTPGGSLTVAIMGDEEAGNWLATTLNRAVSQQGVQLVASSAQRSAPVGH